MSALLKGTPRPVHPRESVSAELETQLEIEREFHRTFFRSTGQCAFIFQLDYSRVTFVGENLAEVCGVDVDLNGGSWADFANAIAPRDRLRVSGEINDFVATARETETPSFSFQTNFVGMNGRSIRLEAFAMTMGRVLFTLCTVPSREEVMAPLNEINGKAAEIRRLLTGSNAKLERSVGTILAYADKIQKTSARALELIARSALSK